MEPVINRTTSKHPEWNESYYFAFYSKEHKLGGASRIGFKPNKPEGMTFFFLFLPDGSAAGYHLTNKTREYSKSLQVGGMAHLPQSDETWKYEFRGNMILVKNPETLPKVRDQPKLIAGTPKVEMRFTFSPINKPYEYAEYMTPESLELGKKAGDKHWEQIAKITGKLSIDEKTYEMENMIGQRDHTYGVRDWTGVGNWLYYVVWFNEKLAINPAAIVADNGLMSTGGFLFKDGKNIPLKTIRILDQRFREDGVFPVSSELEIVDNLGKKHSLKARVGPIVPVPFQDEGGNQSILIQSFGGFELDGVTGGYGTFETLRKAKKDPVRQGGGITISAYEWSKEICHDCGAKVGETHKPGCGKEVCPICGKRLIRCGHSDEMEKRKLPRIPHIQPIVVCSVCGQLFPRLIKVEKDDWEKYVIPPLQPKALCRRCYDQMKELFPDGWNKLRK